MDPVSDWILLPYWSLDTDHSFCSICSVQHVRPLGHICSCEPERQKERNEKLSPKIEFLYLYSIVSNNRTKSDKKGQFYVAQWGPMLLKWNFRRFWFLRWHFICLHISWKSAKGFGFILFCLRERAILLKLVFWESIIFYIIFVVFISKYWGVRIHFWSLPLDARLSKDESYA